PAADSSLDLSAPATRARPAPPPPARADTSLDLSAPASPPPAAAPAADTSLDLTRPSTRPSAPPSAPPRPSAPAADTSLDLSTPVPPPAARSRPARPPAPTPARRNRPPLPRVRPGTDLILGPKAPTVWLTRLQSAIGQLTLEAACSDVVGDLRLGCAYQLRSGHSSTVQHSGGYALAPRDSTRPVITAGRERFERLTVDLRQSLELERLVVFAFSESRATLNWDGTLLVTTYGGAKVELPIAREPSAGVVVLLSLYNVHGEYVVRAESEEPFASIRDACQAFGYERITWLDDRTPVE
ncbi:MAG: hypothetical protein ACJ73S_22740, partial [Mycobacteriales bacterium]